ncbi:MAG: hypothetical protein GTO39_15025, partial [Pseudomonas stutzeri]|nr:hypothetical protein [Stutzerimonas stutzeri]NIN81839.1 hypothetical protein [Stutzerimonas stutzeri]NIQ23687.1 hypothetical protein [Stutzerimonas stutzeri]NIQ42435.1 hypothetical protein [Stutzerimonas stutzeri]NIS57859.1 hypothetical protein [Stutzerimonas stutzeri]
MSDNTTSSHVREDLLMQLADGELHGEQRLRVDAHLQACARCQSRLAMIRSESEAIGKSLAPGKDGRNLAAA